MACYFNKFIIQPERDVNLSEADLYARMSDAGIAIGQRVIVSGCPKIRVTKVFETGFDGTEKKFSDSGAEYEGCIQIGNDVLLDSSSHPAFPNVPINISCLKLPEKPTGKIIIGNDVCLQGTSIVSYERVTIGNEVVFGPMVIMMDCDGHSLVNRGNHDEVSRLEVAPIFISDGVWVGYGVTILKGVSIGENSVIGANSVVCKSVPANVVVAGNPAKIIKEL